MKVVTWHGKRDVRVDTVPDPEVKEPTDAISLGVAACRCHQTPSVYLRETVHYITNCRSPTALPRGVTTAYRWAWRSAIIAQCVVERRIKRQDGVNSEQPDRPAGGGPFGDDPESRTYCVSLLLRCQQNAHSYRGKKLHLREVNDEADRLLAERVTDSLGKLWCAEYVDGVTNRQHHDPVDPAFSNFKPVLVGRGGGVGWLSEVIDHCGTPFDHSKDDRGCEPF